METDFGRNVTGRVDFFLNGSPAATKPATLARLAARTRYRRDRAAEFHYGGLTAKLTPPDFQRLALAQAVTTGLLLFKIDVTGETRPRNIVFDPGTYYFFLNLVDERWLGRAIDVRGNIFCTTLGAIFRQQVNYHAARTPAEHPSISLHRVFESGARRQPRASRSLRLQEADSGWADVQIDWTPFGAGCWKTIVCVPGPDQ